MLIPASDDSNRKAELKRRESQPHAFGSPKLDVKEVTGRKLEGHKLVDPNGKQAETEEQRLAREQEELEAAQAEQAALEAAQARIEWIQYLDQSVAALIAELPEIEGTEQLVAMSAIEAETKNRTTLISAIAAEIAKRGE